MNDASLNRGWISVANAIEQIVESSLLDEFSAVDFIETGLAAGKLKSRSRGVRELAENADTSSSLRKATASDAPFKEIEKPFWRVGARFSSNVFEELLFDAPLGIVMPEPPDHVIEDLQISRADLRQWILTNGSVSISPSSRGAPPKEQTWAFLMSWLVEEARRYGLTEDKYPDYDALIGAISGAWINVEAHEPTSPTAPAGHPKVLDERTVRSVLRAVWEQTIKGHKSDV